AMAKESARRYQTASALGDDLSRWLAGDPIRARPAGAIEKGWRWCSRHPLEAILVGSIALLLLVMAIGASASAYWLAQERNNVIAERNTAFENLRESYLSQAQARRWSGQAGRRFTSLDVLAKAAHISPGIDLAHKTAGVHS